MKTLPKSFCLLLVLLFLGYIPAKSQTNSQGFFLDNWQQKNMVNPSYVPASATTLTPTSTVTVDASAEISKVSKYVFGHNAAVWGGKIEQDLPLLGKIQNLKPNVIRWPGGNMSNDYFWNATSKATCPADLPPNFSYSDMYYGSNKNSWTMPLDSYYDLLTKSGSDGIICVNYAYARYGTSKDPVATAAHLAAEWVRHDKGRTKFWEIGNENYGSWETGFTIDTQYNKDGQPAIISGDLYGRHCRVFIDSMRAAAKQVGANIKIGVVLFSSDKWFVGPVSKVWNEGVIKQAAAKADFLIVHNYFGSTTETNVSTILTTATNEVGQIRNLIDSQLKTFANLDPKPMSMTEWNINPKGQKQASSYVNGMHATLMLGELIKNKYGEANRWDFLNGWDNGDTHGLFIDGDEPGVTKHLPRAPYFYMYYFQKFFGDKLIASTVTGNTNVISYASKFSSGQNSVVLVNKGATSQVVNLQMKNFKTGQRYYYYLLTGGTDNGDFSRKVIVNGQTTSEAGGGPTDFATLKPYGTVITGGTINLNMPKYSVLYVLVENNPVVVQSQTITFPLLAAKFVGDADFSAGATASSGLVVSYTSSNLAVATIVNGQIHIVGTGATTITATQAGNSTYSATAAVTRSLTVNPKPASEINIVQANVSITSGSGQYNFPSLSLGSTSAAVTFTVQNSGNSNLTVGAITLGGNNPYQFAVTQILNSNIGSPGTSTFTVTFKPTIAGAKTALVSIVSNDSNENPYQFTVTGTALSIIKDCAGIINGTATIDVCGTCVGGTTGKVSLDTDKDGQADCVDADDDNDLILDVNDCAPLDATIKGKITWFADTDGDGKGDAAVSIMACTKPLGYVAVAGDVCPFDGSKIAPGNCGCNKTETSCIVTSPIKGADCGLPEQVLSFTLDASKKTNATNYKWWLNGAATSGTPSADGTLGSIKLSPYFTGGEVCVGINLSVSPYYVQYCKAVTTCAAPSTLLAPAPEVMIYPNPATTNLTVDASIINVIPAKIEILNSYGKVILTTSATNLQTVISVDGLGEGTYSVKTYFGNTISTQKLLIIK